MTAHTSETATRGRAGRVSMAVASAVCGLTAAWATHQTIAQRVADVEARARVPTSPRLVATFDLAAGDRLDDSVVAVRETPLEWSHQDALRPDDFAEWEGATLTHPVRQGDLVLSTYLGRATVAPLSARLGPGRRAVTIPVDDISSQAGMVQPRDRLDVYVTLQREADRITALLLRNVAVLAVGQRGPDENDDAARTFSTVTLDVSQAEAVRLVAARQAGTLSAILREDEEGDSQDGAVALSRDLQVALGLAPPQVIPRRVPVPVHYGLEPSVAAGGGNAWSPQPVRQLDASSARDEPHDVR